MQKLCSSQTLPTAAKPRRSSRAGISAWHEAPFPGHLAEGFPLGLRLSQRCMAASGSSFQILLHTPVLSQGSALHHIWRISLTTPTSFPFYLSQVFPCNKSLTLLIRSWHSICFLENPTLSSIFKSFTCLFMFFVLLFSLVFLQYHLIILNLAYMVLYDQISPYLSNLISHHHS